MKYRFHMALFIDTYNEKYRKEISKPGASSTEEIEKAKALVAEKLKTNTASDNNAC